MVGVYLVFLQENRGPKTKPGISHTFACLHLKRSRGEERLWLTSDVYHDGTKSCVAPSVCVCAVGGKVNILVCWITSAEEKHASIKMTGLPVLFEYFPNRWWFVGIFVVWGWGDRGFRLCCLPAQNMFSFPKQEDLIRASGAVFKRKSVEKASFWT